MQAQEFGVIFYTTEFAGKEKCSKLPKSLSTVGTDDALGLNGLSNNSL
jgi:hypothetical protein